ncbi:MULTISPECIES: hypothetical protein [Hymenobacter]|uniref:Uncharacterized protein n=1 Tax=Hymenobacter metallilatus TaxID=2493666 RepID=A0A428JK30_9BACT|nr:hypothetical protein [Hymenobacter metallilatus]RSK33107.1 hypothetical protein EI290_10345 [Hymenobacter metallilatus]
MRSEPTTWPDSRGLLLGLLLATLLLSTGLNLYLLCRAPAWPASDEPLLESAATAELVQTRRALAACQAGHSLPADSLASSFPATP